MSWQDVDGSLCEVVDLLEKNQAEAALYRLNEIVGSQHFAASDMWRVWEHYALCSHHLSDLIGAQRFYWRAICAADGEFLASERKDFSDYLLNMHFFPDVSDRELFRMHLLYQKLYGKLPPFAHVKRRHDRLKIGYLADTFSENVLSSFTVQLLMAYQRSEFEIYCYGVNSQTDALSEQIKANVSGWRMFVPQDGDFCVANQIYDDEIDILVDLCAHASGGLTLPIMARKPAPVQVAGLGYMSTTGLNAVDYFFTDTWLSPTADCQDFFTEKLLILPHSHLCYTPSVRVLNCRSVYAPTSQIRFGSFNRFDKITPDMLQAWREILLKVPNSTIIMRNGGTTNKKLRFAQDNLLKKAQSVNFPVERLIIEPNDSDYMDRYNHIDNANQGLDNTPYRATATRPNM